MCYKSVLIYCLIILCTDNCLSALSPPVISDISKDIVAGIGDDIELNCTVQNVGDLTVSWAKYATEHESEAAGSSVVLSMRNMLSLSDSRYAINVIKHNDASSVTYSLKITTAEANDMGVYECQVIVSAADKLTKKLKVSIKHPAQISEERTPKSMLVTEGQPLEVTCRAMGFPQPSIYWTRENNAIMPAGGHSQTGATLRIKQAHRLDRGGYYCNADNGVGPVAKRLVRIEVEFRPQIAARRPKIAQMLSHTAELECTVQAYPAPAVFWHRNGEQLQSNRYYEVSNTASAFETTTSVLRISSVSSSDYGDYFCNATNKLGHADARLHLFQPVIPVPSF